jgi:ribosomal peptide maturation radical SAM protein 1
MNPTTITQQRERVALVVMPVVNVDRPSISITKLRTVLDERHAERISTEIHYLCHDFAEYMNEGARWGGLELHDVLLDFQFVGLPDWFFRQVAFPQLPDNAEAYFRRYFPGASDSVKALRAAILERRAGLEAFLDGLIDRYALDRARIVGFTSLFVQSGAVFAMARLLKRRRPDITIVMGGQNCDTPMGEEYARNVEAVDYVFSGPGMVNFPAFVAHCLDGDAAACEQLKGVFTRRRPDRGAGERAGEELDIDVEVRLDYSEFFDSFDRRFRASGAQPQVHLETSRGCWWGERSHCTFCGLNGDTMAYRAMAADKAIGLFKDLFARYGDKSEVFFTVDNILPKNYVKEVLPHIEAPPGAKIFYEVKANMSAEELAVMADAGVAWIQPGIEALSTASLRLMKKGSTVFVNLRLLKNCLRFGIDPIWSLLVGFPGESAEVYEQYVRDLPLVTHLRPPKGVAAIHFDRYSPYHFRAQEYGLKLKPVDYYGYCFPFPESSIENMAYFFTDTNYDAPHYTGIAVWMKAMKERVAAWRARWELDGRDIWEYVGDEVAGPKLELRRDGARPRVFDSRGEEPQEFELDRDQLRLLEYLESERSVGSILGYGVEQGFDAQAALAVLEQRRLLWREGDRLLGLVMLDPQACGGPRSAGAPA